MTVFTLLMQLQIHILATKWQKLQMNVGQILNNNGAIVSAVQEWFMHNYVHCNTEQTYLYLDSKLTTGLLLGP